MPSVRFRTSYTETDSGPWTQFHKLSVDPDALAPTSVLRPTRRVWLARPSELITGTIDPVRMPTHGARPGGGGGAAARDALSSDVFYTIT